VVVLLFLDLLGLLQGLSLVASQLARDLSDKDPTR
jgi:hypothetical protein